MVMASALSDCPVCGKPGGWSFDDDWCHEDCDDALWCPHEGCLPGCECYASNADRVELIELQPYDEESRRD